MMSRCVRALQSQRAALGAQISQTERSHGQRAADDTTFKQRVPPKLKAPPTKVPQIAAVRRSPGQLQTVPRVQRALR